MNTTPTLQDILLVSSPETAEKTQQIQQQLGTLLDTTISTYTMPYDTFADGGYNVEFKERLSGKSVWIYADCYSDDPRADLNSKYMFYRHILSACQENRVNDINIIYPCFPYSRSDKEPDAGGENTSKKVPIMAPWVLDDAARHGVEHLITLDIHNQGVLSRSRTASPKNTTNLYYKWMMDYAMRDLDKQNTEAGSTDLGGTKKIGLYAKVVGLNSYIAYKERDNTVPNSVKQVFVEHGFAEITGKDIIIYDDMIDTGGTMCQIIEEISKKKPRSIKVVSPHGMFNNDALEKLETYVNNRTIREIIVSDSITRQDLPDRITVLTTHKLFANTIASLLQGQEVHRNAA